MHDAAKLKRLVGCVVVAAAAVLCCVGQSRAGPLEDGLAAASTGDYGRAESIWRAAANHGNGAEAYQLGEMYEKGHGRPIDHDVAKHWYSISALLGDKSAQTWVAKLDISEGRAPTYDLQRINETPAQAKARWDKAMADAQADFDRKTAEATRLFDAYRDCAVHEARRVEPSGEPADVIGRVAVRPCGHILVDGASPGAGLTAQVMNNFEEAASKDATLAVINVRAARATHQHQR